MDLEGQNTWYDKNYDWKLAARLRVGFAAWPSVVAFLRYFLDTLITITTVFPQINAPKIW